MSALCIQSHPRFPHTVDVRLERLAAHFALQISDARFLFDGDGDGMFVVAEKALEGRRELLLLYNLSAEFRAALRPETYLLGALRLAGRLALALCTVSMRMRPEGCAACHFGF